MRIVNIVDSLDQVNFGIWNAALFTTGELKRQWDVKSELWAPKRTDWDGALYDLDGVRMLDGTGRRDFETNIGEAQLNKAETVIVTHGVWTFCSRWGTWLADLGFQWMLVPHGMLEPWPLRQKWIRKRIYRLMAEDRYVGAAHLVRAVSSPERANLRRLFPKHPHIELIPNGVDVPDFDISSKNLEQKTILFMGRLHKKKCVTELVDAFVSATAARKAFRLLIVGPDQGETNKIQAILRRTDCRQVELLGPVFGEQKIKLLEQASFFALPSQSEGFPTSIVEAMSYGCLPILSEECNFPEAQDEGLGIMVLPQTESIASGLMEAAKMDDADLRNKQRQAAQFIGDNYATATIAQLQYQACQRLLGNC